MAWNVKKEMPKGNLGIFQGVMPINDAKNPAYLYHPNINRLAVMPMIKSFVFGVLRALAKKWLTIIESSKTRT